MDENNNWYLIQGYVGKKPTFLAILENRGYKIKTSQFSPLKNNRLDSLLELDRELDPKTVRKIK